ncbi:hypothetical protein K438DRAFT_2145683 [Mycena galopus ATCC 62051]|nr:hypothetical protein K438DRAFT_2145683 [Mycena galopus ATCC 62051]
MTSPALTLPSATRMERRRSFGWSTPPIDLLATFRTHNLGRPYLALFLVSLYPSQMARACTSTNTCPDHRCILDLDANATRPLCRLRSTILVVATSTSPHLPLLGTRLRIVVGPHRDTLVEHPPAIYPMLSSLPPPTPSSHASIHGGDFIAGTQCLRRFPVVLLRVKAMLQARVARHGKRTGGERVCQSLVLWDRAVFAPRKMVVICLFARGFSRCTSALRWPKVAHTSFTINWTRRLCPNVPALQSSPASCTRAALKGLSPRLCRRRPSSAPAPQRHLPPVCRSLLRICVALRLISWSPTPPVPSSPFPIHGGFTTVCPLRRQATRGLVAQPSHRKTSLAAASLRQLGTGKKNRCYSRYEYTLRKYDSAGNDKARLRKFLSDCWRKTGKKAFIWKSEDVGNGRKMISRPAGGQLGFKIEYVKGSVPLPEPQYKSRFKICGVSSLQIKRLTAHASNASSDWQEHEKWFIDFVFTGCVGDMFKIRG